MMPQRETNESTSEQLEPTYGKYEGEQASTRYADEIADIQPIRETTGTKVHSSRGMDRNALRFLMFLTAMIMLVIFAILCLFFFGGIGGWISFVVAAGVIFLTTAVVIEKIE